MKYKLKLYRKIKRNTGENNNIIKYYTKHITHFLQIFHTPDITPLRDKTKRVLNIDIKELETLVSIKELK